MELYQWVLQLKSLAAQSLSNQIIPFQLSRDLNLSDIQIAATYADSVILLGYLILLASKMSADRAFVLSAFLLSAAVAYSPIYDALSQVQLYCAYSLIYVKILTHVTNKQIKTTIVIMSAFQLFMAMDSYANPTIETWLYRNFEEVTILIHCLIVSSCYRLKPINLGSFLGRFIDSLCGLARSQCLTARL